MPRVSRWMIKAALIYFGLGITLGAYLLLQKATLNDPDVWQVLPYHIEVMVFGWILQFVMGVAYWMLPRFVEGPPRGPAWHSWLMAVLLNAGILLNILHFTLTSSSAALALLARVFQVSSIGLFIGIHWQRIYGIGARS
jgi:hypothetical protein